MINFEGSALAPVALLASKVFFMLFSLLLTVLVSTELKTLFCMPFYHSMLLELITVDEISQKES